MKNIMPSQTRKTKKRGARSWSAGYEWLFKRGGGTRDAMTFFLVGYAVSSSPPAVPRLVLWSSCSPPAIITHCAAFLKHLRVRICHTHLPSFNYEYYTPRVNKTFLDRRHGLTGAFVDAFLNQGVFSFNQHRIAQSQVTISISTT